MEALEFARERRRICNEFESCDLCPLAYVHCTIGVEDFTETADKRVIEAVEKWSAEHPRKTRQSEMLKLFPDTTLDECGVIDICPMVVGNYRNCAEGGCAECKEKWWNEEVK